MRVPDCNDRPRTLFWSAVYVLALLSIYTVGVLACTPGLKSAPRKSIRSQPETE